MLAHCFCCHIFHSESFRDLSVGLFVCSLTDCFRTLVMSFRNIARSNCSLCLSVIDHDFSLLDTTTKNAKTRERETRGDCRRIKSKDD